MASGKTLELRELSSTFTQEAYFRNFDMPRETRKRDRSLRGKARIKARKSA